jgi:hypothetical protein
MVKLSKAEAQILRALLDSHALKSHRYLDGTKIHQLHSLAGEAEPVQKHVVDVLQKRGFVISNQKFPAATYSLTAQGREVAAGLEKTQRR